MVEFRNANGLYLWLESKPHTWSQALAFRSALRVTPHIARRGEIDADVERPLYFYAFCFLFDAWMGLGRARGNFWIPYEDKERILADVPLEDVAAGRAIVKLSSDYYGNEVVSVAAQAAADAAGVDVLHGPLGGHTRGAAVTSAAARSVIWMEASMDADLILASPRSLEVPLPLIGEELWHLGHPQWTRRARAAFQERLLRVGPEFAPWLAWYDRRLSGERAASADGAAEDERMLDKLRSLPETFWKASPEEAAAEIEGWFRPSTGAAPAKAAPDRERVTERAGELASPDVILKNQQLHTVANATFDRPLSIDHERLGAVLGGIASAVIDALPGNAAPILGSALSGYCQELRSRSGSPFVGLLQILGSSIEAEVNAAEPETWSPGIWHLLEAFIANHHLLTSEFPGAGERERFYAETPIDEERASGEAIVGPVDAAADALRELSAAGLTTDQFDAFVEQQAKQGREIACTRDLAAAEAGRATPKRRFVLGTIGFYERVLLALSAIATISMTPVIRAVALAVSNALERLLMLVT